jgi:tetratricopeptide (TPR) repeat protein
MQKNTILVTGVFILAILAVGLYSYFYAFNDDRYTEDDTNINKNIENEGYQGYRTKEELPPFPKGYDVINYDEKVLADIPPERRKEQEDFFANNLAKIEEAPDSLDYWINLGLTKKVFGDYKGAGDVWEYASLIRPKNSSSYINLGDLYWNFLADFPKAEHNYLKAIEISSNRAGIYKDLSDLYRFSFVEKAHLADDILISGAENNPENPDFYTWLGGYYRDMGDAPRAREYFKKALEINPFSDAVKGELDALDGSR